MGDPKALMKEGEEALKTSMFKWEPDHVAAASRFEQAGRAYRAKGDPESALGAYVKAAKSHLSKGGAGYEAAAAAYMQAGQVYPPKAADMYMKSVELFSANGNVEQAIEVMGKAADSFEKSGDQEAALNLYIKAIDLAVIDEFTRAIVMQRMWTVLNNGFKKLIAARRLPEASKCANKMLAIQKVRNEKSPKMILQIVILYLARSDIAAARNLVNSCLEDTEFIRSSEGDAAQDLIDAYERFDSEKIKKLVEGPIKYLDVQVVYLARELAPAQSSGSAAPKAVAPTPQMSSEKAALFTSSASKSAVPNAATKAPAAGQTVSTPSKTASVATPTTAASTTPSTVSTSAPVRVAPPAQPAIAPAEPSYDFDLPDIR